MKKLLSARWDLLAVTVLLSSAAANAAEVLPQRVVSFPYPRFARLAGVTGELKLRVSVAKDGSVNKVDPLQSHPLLRIGTIEGIRKWKWSGCADECTVEVT